MSNQLLKKVQATEFEILVEIDRICKEENIKYFLFYGTLLGAVRHNGFIPWDDDIDIALLREDYDRLMQVLPEKLSEEFWLQNHQTDEHYWLAFAKVRKKGTLYKEKNTEKIPDEKCGVWVDIFPLDHTPANQLVNKVVVKLINQIGLSVRQRELGVKMRTLSLRNIPLLLFWKLFPLKAIKAFQDKLLRVGNKKRSNKYSQMREYGLDYPKEYFEERYILFENRQFPIPLESEKILTMYFGDYMQLPPEDERRTHLPERVVL